MGNNDSSAVRILLADDHRIFRDGLKLLLSTQPGLHIVAETDRVDAIKDLVIAHTPDLLVLDYHMPGGDTGALVGYLRQRYPELKLIMLTGAQSAVVIRQLVDLDAHGVLLKHIGATELLKSIQRVVAGERVLPNEVTALAAQADLQLTARELQVLKLVYDGHSNNEIAQQLSLSAKTVDKHRENLMRKMETNNVAQLVRKVHALKLLDSNA
jgi:DNA-binding NarL/FixJ family response regulator